VPGEWVVFAADYRQHTGVARVTIAHYAERTMPLCGRASLVRWPDGTARQRWGAMPDEKRCAKCARMLAATGG